MTQTKTKKALLMSVLSMVLCVAMLVGMTFAWFTDTASTAVNKIQAGTLKVDIVNEDGNSIKGQSMSFVNKDGNANILWEPGATFRTTGFQIKNDGNLALKYKLQLNGISGNSELLDVIKFSIVKADDSEFMEVPIDTFEGTLTPENDASKLSEVLYIQGHMEETANNDYQGKVLTGLGITVVATQLNHESDSTGPNYDINAPLNFVSVGTTEELKAVFANAKAGEDVNVSLTGDVTITEQTLMVADENTPNIGNINIQGNGNTITNSNEGARCIQLAKFDSTRTITISDVKIVSESTATDNTERRGLQLFTVKNAKINLINCEIEMRSNNYSYPIKIGGTSENLTVNITGCTLTGANCIDSYGKNCTVNITDCVLNSNYVGTPQHLGNCINDQNGISNTYNIKNTTFNGNWAQPWGSKRAGIIFNNLGGNVNNTGNQQFAME